MGTQREPETGQTLVQDRATSGLVAQMGIGCFNCDCSIWTCEDPIGCICAGRLLLLSKLLVRSLSASRSSNYIQTRLSLSGASE